MWLYDKTQHWRDDHDAYWLSQGRGYYDTDRICATCFEVVAESWDHRCHACDLLHHQECVTRKPGIYAFYLFCSACNGTD